MGMSTSTQELLPDELLATFRERAAVYDRENRFFDETLADLRERGYLKLLVPKEFGGLGGTILEATRLQRRLAGADPAAALGVNMHLVLTGAATIALRRGLEPARRVLEEAAAGELFAFGISEAGNDLMLFDSLSKAAPLAGGGYSLTGTKIFTSMAHAWTRLVTHAKVAADDPADERVVFGVLDSRDGIEVLNDWNAHGMRGTDSSTHKLEGAKLAPDRVLALVGVGPEQDPLRFGIFGAFELLLASVYCGVGERAVQVAVEAAPKRRSATTGLTANDNEAVRWRLAEAALQMDGAVLQIEKVAFDMDAVGLPERPAGAEEYGRRWYLHFSGVKARTAAAAVRAVDECIRASGGRHYYLGSELERLSRDVRASVYQPSSDESVRSSYARALLGDVGQPRQQ